MVFANQYTVIFSLLSVVSSIKCTGRTDLTYCNSVCVISIAGLIPFAAMPSYTAAKHGVVGMTKALGVRAFTISCTLILAADWSISLLFCTALGVKVACNDWQC